MVKSFFLFLLIFIFFSCSQLQVKKKNRDNDIVSFASPWTSSFRQDPIYPSQLVNNEGEHLLILNKTEWAYFASVDPEGVLERAKAQGVNVIRVCLEGTPYFDVLKMDCWPWGGTRQNPDYSQFNESYWNEVERRIRLAGEYGIGIDLNLYFTLRKQAYQLPYQKKYWDQILQRLGKYSNILTWEIMNEYLGNESFQDSVGWYLYRNDPWHHPVITSDGTTDDAAWPHKKWMGMAVVHTSELNQYMYEPQPSPSTFYAARQHHQWFHPM